MSAPEHADAWRPTATVATLRLRAQLLAATRRFFAERRVLEVDTPSLVRRAVSEPHLHSAEVRLPGRSDPLFLTTSPEYAMKRLLAAGCPDIYQMGHVVRGAELSRLHNPEFTLIEWYRLGFDLRELMLETAELARELLGLPADAPLQSLSYVEAFERALGADPMLLPDEQLRRLAATHGLDAPLAQRCTRDELLDWLMAVAVGARLGGEQLCCLHHYPASQAALARLDPLDQRFALRFELYYRGVELANGFEELADALEQRSRFQAEQHERQRRALPVHELDERLLEALEHGLPAVAGVALGFDRALMLRIGASDIRSVLAFPTDRA
jgi:elongation factor P--(R)-beta-lysine ligase